MPSHARRPRRARALAAPGASPASRLPQRLVRDLKDRQRERARLAAARLRRRHRVAAAQRERPPRRTASQPTTPADALLDRAHDVTVRQRSAAAGLSAVHLPTACASPGGQRQSAEAVPAPSGNVAQISPPACRTVRECSRAPRDDHARAPQHAAARGCSCRRRRLRARSDQDREAQRERARATVASAAAGARAARAGNAHRAALIRRSARERAISSTRNLEEKAS